MSLVVPEWVLEYIRLWRDVLYLRHWQIDIVIELCVNYDTDCRALTEQFPDANHARLTFRADIEETPEWKTTIIHELLHIAHARIDHLVESAFIPEMKHADTLAREVYHQYIESYTAQFAEILHNMMHKED